MQELVDYDVFADNHDIAVELDSIGIAGDVIFLTTARELALTKKAEDTEKHDTGLMTVANAARQAGPEAGQDSVIVDLTQNKTMDEEKQNSILRLQSGRLGQGSRKVSSKKGPADESKWEGFLADSGNRRL